ncbi:hypothetical protein FRC01_002107 [Tulasnella sp. 417]|nr:hypothetical protein FRC01_002107 [Tulasnella sp. 417]
MQYSTFALHRIFTGYLSSEITTVTLSPEGLLAPLAFATLPETAHATTCIWRKSSFVFATSDGMVASSAFHRDSEKISSNIIREIAIDKLLQFASSVQWVPYIDPRAAVECLAAHVESGQIAIATDNSVEVWRLRSGQDRYEFIRRLVAPQPVQGAKFSYLAFLDKTQLLGWRRHGPLMFWSVALGTSYAIDGLAASTYVKRPLGPSGTHILPRKVLATFKHYLSTAGDDGVRLYNLQGSGLRLLHKVEVKDYVGGATAFDMVGNSNCILVAYARKSGGLCLINFPLKLTQTPTVIVSTDGTTPDSPILNHLIHNYDVLL